MARYADEAVASTLTASARAASDRQLHRSSSRGLRADTPFRSHECVDLLLHAAEARGFRLTRPEPERTHVEEPVAQHLKNDLEHDIHHRILTSTRFYSWCKQPLRMGT